MFATIRNHKFLTSAAVAVALYVAFKSVETKSPVMAHHAQARSDDLAKMRGEVGHVVKSHGQALTQDVKREGKELLHGAKEAVVLNVPSLGKTIEDGEHTIEEIAIGTKGSKKRASGGGGVVTNSQRTFVPEHMVVVIDEDEEKKI